MQQLLRIRCILDFGRPRGNPPTQDSQNFDEQQLRCGYLPLRLIQTILNLSPLRQ